MAGVEVLNSLCCLAFLNPGPQETLIIGVVGLLLFGRYLPSAAQRLDKEFTELQYRLAEVQQPELILVVLIGLLVIVLLLVRLASLQ